MSAFSSKSSKVLVSVLGMSLSKFLRDSMWAEENCARQHVVLFEGDLSEAA